MDNELRNKCIELYGEEFASIYDYLNQGQSIGGLNKTIEAIEKIEQAKRVVEAERTKGWVKKIKSYLLIKNN